MNTTPQSVVFFVRPPSPAEVDQLATISAISFIVGVVAFLLVVGAALAVALKTRVPGRWAIFVSLVLLSAWWIVAQIYGGDLEGVFGPVAVLVTYTVYSAVSLMFAIGYLRMSFAVMKQPLSETPGNEA